jgi:hypothetical protein
MHPDRGRSPAARTHPWQVWRLSPSSAAEADALPVLSKEAKNLTLARIQPSESVGLS